MSKNSLSSFYFPAVRQLIPLPPSCNPAQGNAFVTHPVRGGQCILRSLALAGSLLSGGAEVGTLHCFGEWHLHGDTWPDQVWWPPRPLPRSLKGTNTVNQLSHCVLSTIKHFCHLPLARFPLTLHQLGTSPRNTVFAQSGCRVGMYGGESPSCFSFCVSGGPYLAMAFTSLLCLPAVID